MTSIELGDLYFAKLGNPVTVVLSVLPSGSVGTAKVITLFTVGYVVPTDRAGVVA